MAAERLAEYVLSSYDPTISAAVPEKAQTIENISASSFSQEASQLAEDAGYAPQVSYPWKRNRHLLTFDASKSAIGQWLHGATCGTRCRMRAGDWAGLECTVVGVRDGFLWRHDDGEQGAGAFNAYSAEELQRGYDLEIIGWVDVAGVRFVAKAVTKRTSVGAERSEVAAGDKPGTPLLSNARSGFLALALFQQGLEVKEPFRYHAPLSIRPRQRAAYSPVHFVEYETAASVLNHYGPFRHGQLVVFRKGPKAGRTAVIIGVHQGRLVRQEDGDAPREFDGTDGTATHDPAVVLSRVPLEPYNAAAPLVAAGSTFVRDDALLVERWGYVSGMRLRHLLGAYSGTVGVVLGICETDGWLYEYNENLGKIVCLGNCPDAESLLNQHGVKLVGFHRGPVLLPAPPALAPFPSVAPPNAFGLARIGSLAGAPATGGRGAQAATIGSVGSPNLTLMAAPAGSTMRRFDVRYSECAACIGQPGQAVRVTVGRRHGRIGRLVGVCEGKMWAVFDAVTGLAEPLNVEERCVLLPRPTEPLAASHLNPDGGGPLPKLVAFPVMSVFGVVIAVDPRPSSTEPFGLFTTQRIVYGRRGEVNPLVDPQEEGRAREPSPGWRRATVVGVHRLELWVVDEGAWAASPLLGCNRAGIMTHYRLAVCGLATNLAAFHDPFIDTPTAADGGRPAAPTGRLRWERALQEDAALVRFPALMSRAAGQAASGADGPSKLLLATGGGSPTGTTRRRAPQHVKGAVQMTFATSSDAFDGLQCVLRFKNRVRITPRTAPRISRRGSNAPQKTDEWALFAPPAWCTVLGVAEGKVWAVFDVFQWAAVPLEAQDLPACVAADNASAGPELRAPPIPTWEAFATVTVVDPLEAASAADEGVYPTFPTPLMDARTVAAAAAAMDAARVGEMRLAFGLLPKEVLVEVLDWVLGLHGLHMAENETVSAAMQRLCAVLDISGTALLFAPPTAPQWQRRQVEVFLQREGKMREMAEMGEKEARYQLDFRMQAERFRRLLDEEDLHPKASSSRRPRSGEATPPLLPGSHHEDASSSRHPTPLPDISLTLTPPEAKGGGENAAAAERGPPSTTRSVRDDDDGDGEASGQASPAARSPAPRRLLLSPHAASDDEEEDLLDASGLVVEPGAGKATMQFGWMPPSAAAGKAAVVPLPEALGGEGTKQFGGPGGGSSSSESSDEPPSRSIAEAYRALDERQKKSGLQKCEDGEKKKEGVSRQQDALARRFANWRRSVRTVSSLFGDAVFGRVRATIETKEDAVPSAKEEGGAALGAFPSEAVGAAEEGEAAPLPVAGSAALAASGPAGPHGTGSGANLAALLNPAPHWPFSYVLRSGTVVAFDVSRAACQPFGMYHGQRFRITRGDLGGTVVTIIGVGPQKRLWRYSDDCEAQPFQGTHPKDVQKRYALELVEMAGSVRRADPFFFHTTHAELLSFDPSPAACAPFRVSFGDRYAVASTASPLPYGCIITIVGVRDGRVWYARDWSGASSFDGRDIFAEWELRFLYNADVKSLPVARQEALAAGMGHYRRCIVHAAPGTPQLCFDVTRESCAPFGVFPGQHIVHTKGPLVPQAAVVIGTHNGKLFRIVQGDRFATPFDLTPSQFCEAHTVKVVRWTRPQFQDVNFEASPQYAGRLKAFRSVSSVGDVYLFDAREEPCRSIFGFAHGDKVVIRKKGKQYGQMSVVVGMRHGLLWRLDEGEQQATMFHGCRHFRDLEAAYALEFVGRTIVREHVG